MSPESHQKTANRASGDGFESHGNGPYPPSSRRESFNAYVDRVTSPTASEQELREAVQLWLNTPPWWMFWRRRPSPTNEPYRKDDADV